jgi:hypothetical protein
VNVNLWLDEMDHGGIEGVVLSLTQLGIQGIPDRTIAIHTAKRVNDELATIGGKSSCVNFPHTVSFLAAFARGYLRYFSNFLPILDSLKDNSRRVHLVRAGPENDRLQTNKCLKLIDPGKTHAADR